MLELKCCGTVRRSPLVYIHTARKVALHFKLYLVRCE